VPLRKRTFAGLALAKALGLTTAVKTLSTTLSEEVTTDAKLAKANEFAIAMTKKSEGRILAPLQGALK
jgi:ferritin-like metal-binding protein YciE